MITGLDHIAIAVPDLERAIRRFLESAELVPSEAEAVVAPTAPRSPRDWSPVPNFSALSAG